jgi:hypothetical protein
MPISSQLGYAQLGNAPLGSGRFASPPPPPTYAYKTTLWSGYGPTGDAADFTTPDGSTLTSGESATLIGGAGITAIAGDNSFLSGGWGCNLTGGKNCVLIAGRFSAIVADIGSSAQGGFQSSITLSWTGGPVNATVKDSGGLNGTLDANTLYRLDASGNFILSGTPIPPLPPRPPIPGVPPTPDPPILPVAVVLTGGDNATLTGGEAATLTAGKNSTLIAGSVSTLKCGDHGTLSCGSGSTVTTDSFCTVTAGTLVLQFPPPPPLPEGVDTMTVGDYCFVVAYGSTNTLTALYQGHGPTPPPPPPPGTPSGSGIGNRKTQFVCPPLNPYDRCLNQDMLRAAALKKLPPRCKIQGPYRRSYPQVDMPPQAETLNPHGSIPPPLVASGYVPVFQFNVPQSYEGVLTSLYQTFTGPFAQGSGDLEWSLQVGRWFVKRLTNIGLMLGSAKKDFPLSGGYPLLPNQKVTFFVRNNNAAAIPPGVGMVLCGLKGWTYPRE